MDKLQISQDLFTENYKIFLIEIKKDLKCQQIA